MCLVAILEEDVTGLAALIGDEIKTSLMVIFRNTYIHVGLHQISRRVLLGHRERPSPSPLHQPST